MLGEQAAQLAANGVDIGLGTSVDLLADTAEVGKLEELRIADNAERRALNFENQSSLLQSQAGARTTGTGVGMTGFGTLLGGAADVAFKADDLGIFSDSGGGA
jgi:hypothetical protein